MLNSKDEFGCANPFAQDHTCHSSFLGFITLSPTMKENKQRKKEKKIIYLLIIPYTKVLSCVIIFVYSLHTLLM